MRSIRIAYLLCVCLLASPSLTQDLVHQQTRRGISGTPADEDEATQRLEREMAKKANVEREAALKADSEKLLKLAVELKAYVDKTNEHVLSLEVINKAAEIERLAHSVKEKMKATN